MPIKTDKSKAKPSILAQLVARVMRDDGITRTAEVADAIGVSDRAVRKAKTELLFLGTSVPIGTSVPEQEFQKGTSVPPKPRAHAYKESPTEINNNTNISHTTVSSESVVGAETREGVTAVGHGVFVNCETIRHDDFTISLPALSMAVALRGPSDPEGVKTKCTAIALQWAAEIEAGKLPRDVLPGHIHNFLKAYLIGDINRDAIHEMRLKGAQSKQTQRDLGKSALDRRLEREAVH